MNEFDDGFVESEIEVQDYQPPEIDKKTGMISAFPLEEIAKANLERDEVAEMTALGLGPFPPRRLSFRERLHNFFFYRIYDPDDPEDFDYVSHAVRSRPLDQVSVWRIERVLKRITMRNIEPPGYLKLIHRVAYRIKLLLTTNG